MEFWPADFLAKAKYLTEGYPMCEIDRDTWGRFGPSTKPPPSGILHLRAPFIANPTEGIRINDCFAGKLFILPTHPAGTGCPYYMTYEQWN